MEGYALPSMQRTLAALLLALAAGVRAAPDTPADPLQQLLQDKGVLASTVEPLNRARLMASDLVVSAMNFLGVPYRRGGSSADEGFDCSGFTRHLFDTTLGKVLPHRADQQARDASLAPVDRAELQPGDLVFFNTMKRAFSHVGVYIGDGKFIHSPRTGGKVRIEDMGDRYWRGRYNGARRAVVDGATPPN